MSMLLRLLLLVFFVSTVAADMSPNMTAGSILSTIPDCTVPCVKTTLFEEGGCPQTNAGEISKCTCTNVRLQRRLSACIQTSCRFSAQAKFTKFSGELCEAYPKPSRVKELKVTGIVAIVLSVPFLFLRLYARWLNNRIVWAEEAYTVIAAIFLIASSSITLRMSLLGFGRHYWDIPARHGVELLKLWYVTQMMYIMVQVFSKVAILSLYSRLFGEQKRWFRWFIRGMIAFMFIHGFAFFMLVTFQCLPVAAIWNKSIDGKCLPVNYALGLSGAILSIMEDIIILILPIPQLWSLQMTVKKKIGLVLLLSLGSFAFLTSIIRLKFVLEFANSYDSTWDNVDVVKWSIIEVLAACICGNLMALRPLIERVIPTIRSVVTPSSWIPRQACEKHPNRLESHGCTDGTVTFDNRKNGTITFDNTKDESDMFDRKASSSSSNCTELDDMAQIISREDEGIRLVSR